MTYHEPFKIPPCPFPEEDLKDNECILGTPLYARKTRYDLFSIGGKRLEDRSARPATAEIIHRVTLVHDGLLFVDISAQTRLIDARSGKIAHAYNWVLKAGAVRHELVHTIGLPLLTRHIYQLCFQFDDAHYLAGHYLHALTALGT